MNTPLIRLNKFIANSGYCSRRKADKLISESKVSVNGKIIKNYDYKIIINDIIKINDKRIYIQNLVYIVFNKPKDCICTNKDEKGRKSIYDIIDYKFIDLLNPIGRLDRNTTGVLLLSNDGELNYRLTHPSKIILKEYKVTLDRELNNEDLKIILLGLEIDGHIVKPDKIIFPDESFHEIVNISIHSGAHHIIKRFFNSLNINVLSLERISFAGINKKNLKRGEYRFLTKSEIVLLKKLTGLI